MDSKNHFSERDDGLRRRHEQREATPERHESRDFTDEQVEVVKRYVDLRQAVVQVHSLNIMFLCRTNRCKDYYEVLGVTRDAPDADLKKQYRKVRPRGVMDGLVQG